MPGHTLAEFARSDAGLYMVSFSFSLSDEKDIYVPKSPTEKSSERVWFLRSVWLEPALRPEDFWVSPYIRVTEHRARWLLLKGPKRELNDDLHGVRVNYSSLGEEVTSDELILAGTMGDTWHHGRRFRYS
jgi:hypothetical protein